MLQPVEVLHVDSPIGNSGVHCVGIWDLVIVGSLLLRNASARPSLAILPALPLVVYDEVLGDYLTQDKDPVFLGDIGLLVRVAVDVGEVIVSGHWHSIETQGHQAPIQ